MNRAGSLSGRTVVAKAGASGQVHDLARAFLVDIDGTLALHEGRRNPYDWRLADQDAPNHSVVAVVQALSSYGFAVVFVSGRPEASRSLTARWIEQHVGVVGELHLRPDGDQRKDSIVKRELFERSIAARFDVLGVLDDRQQVVDMWRNELGLTVLQVGPGDF